MQRRAISGYALSNLHIGNASVPNTYAAIHPWLGTGIWSLRQPGHGSRTGQLHVVPSTSNLTISCCVCSDKGLLQSSNSVEAFNQAKSVIEGLVDGTVGSNVLAAFIQFTFITLQIALDETGLDAAKSSIVYSVTRGVSTPGRAVSHTFTVLVYPDIYYLRIGSCVVHQPSLGRRLTTP